MKRKLGTLAAIASLGLLAAGCGSEVAKINDNQWIVYEAIGEYDYADIRKTCETQNQAVADVFDPPVTGEQRGSLAIVTCGDVRVEER